jgi:hypothetical protein
LDVSVLNHTIGRVIRQQLSPDNRTLATFILMLASILASGSVQLSAWISWIPGNTKAESRIRRFSRWLGNSPIRTH